MPYRRKGRKRYRRKRFKKKDKNTVMINRMPKQLKTIVAPKYFTQMEATFQGILGITATQNQGFLISGSIVNNPFNFAGIGPVGSFDNMTGATLVNPGAYTIAGLDPTGLSVLRTIYTTYRVHGSHLTCTFIPQAGADQMEVTILPVIWNTQLGAYASTSTFLEAKAGPWSKNITVTGNNNLAKNTISMRITNRMFHGLTKQQYKDGQSFYDLSTNPSNPSFTATQSIAYAYQIEYQKYNAGVLTMPCGVNIKIVYNVEWYNPITDYPVQ